MPGKCWQLPTKEPIEAVVSEGGLYTMTYLLGVELKGRGVHEPEKTTKVKRLLTTLLHYVHVIRLDDDSIAESLKDTSFSDTEDSYQYHCALSNHCDVLVTINMKHFKHVEDSKMEIITPTQFSEKYIG